MISSQRIRLFVAGFFLVLTQVSCVAGELKTITPIEPVLVAEVIFINGIAKVESINGTAVIKKKNDSKFAPLTVGYQINAGDLCEVKGGAIVVIRYDGKIIRLKSATGSGWYIFKQINEPA